MMDLMAAKTEALERLENDVPELKAKVRTLLLSRPFPVHTTKV